MNSEDLYRAGVTSIETQRGMFHLAQTEFDILDIASGLSKMCRFNGQCSDFYSVAEHSVLVANLMRLGQKGSPFEGLMHDANEAFLPDVPSPYKSVLPDLKALEDGVDGRIRQYFKMPSKKTAECSYADCVALMIEAYYLLPSRGANSYWAPMAQFRPTALMLIDKFPVRCLPPDKAETLFLDNFYTLSEREI